MKSLLLLAGLAMLFAAAPTPRPVPDVAFAGDFIRMQSNTVALLKIAHTNVKDKRVVQSLDQDYDKLSSTVNGLFESVAFDIEQGTPHEADWKAAADAALQQANDFRALLHALAEGRTQAHRGIPGSASIVWDEKQKSVLVKYDIDFSKAQQDSSAAKIQMFEAALKASQDDVKAAEAARAAYAADLRAHEWPARCAVGLEKPACPAARKL